MASVKTEVNEKPLNYLKFEIENITVTRAPMLKVYYWECFDIEGLNKKFDSNIPIQNHDIIMFTRQLNTKPLKVIFWLRNCSNQDITLTLKRIRNCPCLPMETRVGFNQYRYLYQCPHRCLVNIIQEIIVMEPNDLVAMSVTAFFFLLGKNKLTYEIKCSDSRVFYINFYLDIVGFDAEKCFLTNELIPTDIKEYRRLVQPIWVRNITMQHLTFFFTTRDRGLKIINPNLTVPRQSVWPLMIQYRPSDLINELEVILNFNNIRYPLKIHAKGYEGEYISEDTKYPTNDIECIDFPYVIFPNTLNFDMQLGEERSKMVCIQNHNQKCLEFHWQNYVINDLFEITYEPEIFRLKPHHCKLCVVHVRVFKKSLHFKRIPTVLEVHRIFDRPTKIAKELLEEVESIDDPKWAVRSYIQHVFLHLNIKVNFKVEEVNEIPWELSQTKKLKTPKKSTTTIFEKLFWDYLSKSNFMRENKNPKICDELSYKEVLNLSKHYRHQFHSNDGNRKTALKIISQLIADNVRDLSKNWRFIPPDFSEIAS